MIRFSKWLAAMLVAMLMCSMSLSAFAAPDTTVKVDGYTNFKIPFAENQRLWLSTQTVAAVNSDVGTGRNNDDPKVIYHHGWVANSNPVDYTPIRWLTLSDFNGNNTPSATQREDARTRFPVYCIEEGGKFNSRHYVVKKPENSAYWTGTLKTDAKRGIQLATLYGYPANLFGVKSGDAYAATQVVIWEFINGDRSVNPNNFKNPTTTKLSEYALKYPPYANGKGGADKPAMKAYKELLSLIYNHEKRPSFNDTYPAGSPVVLKFDPKTQTYTATLTDTTGILKDMRVDCTIENVDLSIEGNQLKIVAHSKNVNRSNIKLTRNQPVIDKYQPFMVLDSYDTPVNQRAVVGQYVQEINSWIYFKFEDTGTLNLKKTSPDGNISGIAFTVTKKGTTETYHATTDENGLFNLELKPGTYVVTEITPPGYVAQPAQEVTLTTGKTTTVTFNNQLIPKGSLSTTKVDEEYPDNKLTGATFKVYSDENATKEVGTMVESPAGSGEYKLENLTAGTYYMKETVAPYGFELDTNIYPAVVVDKMNTVVTNNAGTGFLNTPKKGALKILKDSEDHKLEGFTFKVESVGKLAGNHTYLQTFTTDENGQIMVEGLYYGTYLVSEVADNQSQNYVLPEPQQVVVDGNAPAVIALSFTNEFPHGKVWLTKYDAEYPDNKLTGAKFAIFADENGNGKLDKSELRSGALLNETTIGIYEYEGLRAGKYLVKELEAPIGFELDTNTYAVVITANTDVVEVKNQAGKGFANSAQKGSLKIQKKNPLEVLEGFTFRVEGVTYSGIPYCEEFVTDENGMIYVDDLRVGEYTVSEVANEATYGYMLPPDQTVIIEADNMAELEFLNRPIPKTGDEANLLLWQAMLLISGGAMVLLLKRKQRSA